MKISTVRLFFFQPLVLYFNKIQIQPRTLQNSRLKKLLCNCVRQKIETRAQPTTRSSFWLCSSRYKLTRTASIWAKITRKLVNHHPHKIQFEVTCFRSLYDRFSVALATINLTCSILTSANVCARSFLSFFVLTIFARDLCSSMLGSIAQW